MSRGRVLLAGLVRFLGLLLLSAAVLAGIALVMVPLTGTTFRRALALGFYGLGAFLMLAGFFVGNRGPVRVRGNPGVAAPVPFVGVRMLRWATAAEQEESLNLSVIFVVLGLSLLALGAVADDAHSLT